MDAQPNPRTLIGVIGLLIGLFFYGLLVAALAASIGDMPLIIEVVFYLFFGLLWLVPMKPLLNWIGRGNPNVDDATH